MRRIAVTSAFALVGVLAFGSIGAAERTAVVPGMTARSADGLLIVSIPPGALKKKTKVTARMLKRSEWPKELRRAKGAAGAKLYELEPDGLRFKKPITITRRFPRFDVSDGIPGMWFASRNSRGKWELLRNQTVKLKGKTVIASGTTTHFSDVVAIDGGGRVSLVPSHYEREVGDRWLPVFKEEGELEVLHAKFAATGAVKAFNHEFGGHLECASVGTGTFTATLTLYDISAPALFAGVFGKKFGRGVALRDKRELKGTANCRALGTPPPGQQPPPPPRVLSSLTLSPTTVTGGNAAVGTVTLSGPAPPGGAEVALASLSSPTEFSTVATVPATVTVPAGATTATFQITTTAVSETTTANIVATYPFVGPGVRKEAELTVTPAVPPACSQPVTAALTTAPPGGPAGAYVHFTGQCDGFFQAGLDASLIDLPSGSQSLGWWAHTTGCTTPPSGPWIWVQCKVKPDGRICVILKIDPPPTAGTQFRVRLLKSDGTVLVDRTVTPAPSEANCPTGS